LLGEGVKEDHKELNAENAKLKRKYADLAMSNEHFGCMLMNDLAV
jgi:hypothetical protein